ncbi:MAG: hypothetical protein WCT37_00025 [Patescibacteria group bacterium]|jgi:hypothetical protein
MSIETADQQTATANDLKFYFQKISRPLAASLGIILFVYLFSLISFLSWSRPALNYFSWAIILILMVMVVWRVAGEKKDRSSHAAIVGVLVGLGAGLGHAILQVVWFWSWWRLTDLVLEPLVLALAGLGIGFLVFKLREKGQAIMAAGRERESAADSVVPTTIVEDIKIDLPAEAVEIIKELPVMPVVLPVIRPKVQKIRPARSRSVESRFNPTVIEKEVAVAAAVETAPAVAIEAEAIVKEPKVKEVKAKIVRQAKSADKNKTKETKNIK